MNFSDPHLGVNHMELRSVDFSGIPSVTFQCLFYLAHRSSVSLPVTHGFFLVTNNIPKPPAEIRKLSDFW